MAQLGAGFDARPMFTAERVELVQMLANFGSAEWSAATVCPGWTVRDIGVHLLHDDLRRLSRSRDGYQEVLPATPREGLPDVLNASNERWVSENRYLSPGLLVELLAHTARALEAMWAAGDLDAPSEGVWWAGVELAPLWLDLARDYSEDWTHQQQIRDAVHRPGLKDSQFLDPVLDTFLCAAPHTYRDVSTAGDVNVRIDVDDHGRTLTWSLRSEPDGWFLSRTPEPLPTASITLPAETLWRLASGGMDRDSAEQTATISGAYDLAGPILNIVSVVR